jgi:hypothetical protein
MTDNAAEAVLYSNLAYENRMNPTYQGYADLAQLHATLALVEQQRIANELTFLRFTLAEIQGGRASDVDDDALQALAKRVTDGLGL